MGSTLRRAFLLGLLSFVFSLAMGFANAQDVTYVCFDGGLARGESNDPSHPDWIFAYGLDHGESVSGGPSYNPVFFLKGTDKATPLLHELLANSTAAAKVVIEVCREPTSGGQECYYRLILENAKVSVMSAAGTSCVDPTTSCTPSQTESVGLEFNRISWSYTEFSGGKAVGTTCRCWNVPSGTSCSCPPGSCSP